LHKFADFLTSFVFFFFFFSLISYIDRGLLQFCPVRIHNGVIINPGATVQPLTEYRENSCLRPFAVTIKGQSLNENTSYSGNPCKPMATQTSSTTIDIAARTSSADTAVHMLLDAEQGL
jgi:hypothetical protein